MDLKDSEQHVASNIPYVSNRDLENDFYKSKISLGSIFQRKMNFICILFSVLLVACFIITMIFVTIQSNELLYNNFIQSGHQGILKNEFTFHKRQPSMGLPLIQENVEKTRVKRQIPQSGSDCYERKEECRTILSSIKGITKAMQEKMTQMHRELTNKGILKPSDQQFRKIVECLQCRDAMIRQAEEETNKDFSLYIDGHGDKDGKINEVDGVGNRENLGELSDERMPDKQVFESMSNNTKKINDTTRVTVILHNTTIIEKDGVPNVVRVNDHYYSPTQYNPSTDQTSHHGLQMRSPQQTNYYNQPRLDHISYEGNGENRPANNRPVDHSYQSTSVNTNPRHGASQYQTPNSGVGRGSEVSHEDKSQHSMPTMQSFGTQKSNKNRFMPQTSSPYMSNCLYGIPLTSSNPYSLISGGQFHEQGNKQPIRIISQHTPSQITYMINPRNSKSSSNIQTSESQQPPYPPQYPQNAFGMSLKQQQQYHLNQGQSLKESNNYHLQQTFSNDLNNNNSPKHCYLPNNKEMELNHQIGKQQQVASFRDIEGAGPRDDENIEIDDPEEFYDCTGFWCPSSKKCLKIDQRCNGKVDCIGAEDEKNCSSKFKYYADLYQKSLSPMLKSVHMQNNIPPLEGFDNSVDMDNYWKQQQIPQARTKPRPSVRPTVISPTIPTESTITKLEPMTIEPTIVENTIPPIAPMPSMPPGFTCTRLMQRIPLEKKCNNVYDCEDTTDEIECTCKDYFTGNLISRICDGQVDCYDGSDEEKCNICDTEEFYCHHSYTCIPKFKQCDGKKDCKFNEDESDCFALTDGEYVNLDFNNRSYLNTEGVLTQYRNGTWRAFNLKSEIRNDSKQFIVDPSICDKLGFKGVESMEEILVRKSKLNVNSTTKDSLVRYNPLHYTPLKLDGGDKNYYGVYIRCKPILSGNMNEHFRIDQKTRDDNYMWPWEASIFSDGQYRCSALLLDNNLLLASSKCADYVNPRTNYCTAVVGASSTDLPFNGPYQQISLIVDSKLLTNSDALVFRLKNNINMTRYVQPIYLEKSYFPPEKYDTCVAIGVNEKYERKIKFLQPVDDCPKCYRCCIERSPSHLCSHEGNGTTWSGSVACLNRGGWYPAAVFQNKDENCGFTTKQTLTSIDYIHAHLSQAISETVEPYTEPPCNGIRCSLGNCIPWDQMCNGVRDCQDGKDELPEKCKNFKDKCDVSDLECKCSRTDLRCDDGKCIPKEMFRDGKNDCDDGSDEPQNNICANYFRLTKPEYICDDRRHCLDRSDESYEHCPCKDSSFKCHKSPYNGTVACLAQDLVCDNHKDCPNGEDEENSYCSIMVFQNNETKGSSEVMRRRFGVLQPECFPRPIETINEATHICNKFGYNFGYPTKEPKITEQQYELRHDFTMVLLNDFTNVTIRPDEPIGVWRKPNTTCYRVIVNCV